MIWKQKRKPSPSERLLILIAGLLGVFFTQSIWAQERILPAVAQLPASNTQSPIQVMGVRLNKTEAGIEVILETKEGEKLQVTNRTQGNSIIAEIPNAVLVLPNKSSFQQQQPVVGITAVTVTQVNPNTIRVTVTGEAGVPKVELFDSDEGLIFGLTPVASATPTPEAQTKPEPSAQSDEPIELVVTGEQDSYRVTNATSATRTDTPLRDIPQSIQVIPQGVLRDQQVTQIDEALRNVSGVTLDNTGVGRGVVFNIRGFANAPVLLDGFRQYGSSNFANGFPETASLERIEVLKGPASVLYGEIQPGGTINLVTKQPLSTPFYEAELQVGSRNFYRPRIDFSGPLTSDGNLLYRLNAVYETGDSYRDFDQNIERFFVGPTVTWKIGDRTDLTVQLEYKDDERPADDGIVAFGNGVIDVPRDRIIDEPDSVNQQTSLNIRYNLEHRFSKNWKLRNAFQFVDSNLSASGIFPISFNEATGIFDGRYYFDQEEKSQNYSLQTNLEGRFNTGSIKHTLLFGVDLNRSNYDRSSRTDFFRNLPLNIFNPVYNQFQPDLDSIPLSTVETDADRLGIYVQDQITLADNLKLLAGLRYDTVEQKTSFQSAPNSTKTENSLNPDAFTPRVGIVYQPIPELSLYGSYSRSFNPNESISSDGNILEPEQGKGYEVGAKAELLGGRLSATLAYFDITKQNVATSDLNFPGRGFSIATGEQHSQGVELDVIGEVLPGWNIIASYAYTDAEITKDNVIAVGNRLSGVPNHSASLWTTYEIQRGSLRGLGGGIGFNYVGEREGDLDNSFKLDSYLLTNAAIFYRRDNWRFGLNFKNIFDVNYIAGTPIVRTIGINPGEPFTVIGSISVHF